MTMPISGNLFLLPGSRMYKMSIKTQEKVKVKRQLKFSLKKSRKKLGKRNISKVIQKKYV